MDPEVIDVPDVIQTTRIPDATLERQERQTASQTADSIIESPDPGTSFNSMRDKLDSLMKDILKPSTDKSPEKPADKPKEATKPEEKPEEDTKPEDKTVADDKVFTSAKAADWKKLKESIKDKETKLAEWQAKYQAKEKELAEVATKLKAEDKTPEFTKQIEEWKQKHDQLASEMERVALERFEPFVNQFNKRFGDAIKLAKEAVGADNAERVEQLLSVTPSKWRKAQLNELMEGLDQMDQGNLVLAVHNMDTARAEKEEKLKDSKTNLARAQGMVAESQARERQLYEARTNETINRVLQMAKNYDAFKADSAEKGLLVKANEEKVAKFFRMELPPEDMAMMPIVAIEGKRIIESVLPALQKENAELKEALKSVEASKPAVTGGKKEADKTKPEGFSEAFQRHWPGQ